MERRCDNCRYVDMDSSSLPCMECSDTHSLWSRDIEDIEDVDDSRELLCAIFETQMYILREIEQVRIKLEKE